MASPVHSHFGGTGRWLLHSCDLGGHRALRMASSASLKTHIVLTLKFFVHDLHPFNQCFSEPEVSHCSYSYRDLNTIKVTWGHEARCLIWRATCPYVLILDIGISSVCISSSDCL